MAALLFVGSRTRQTSRKVALSPFLCVCLSLSSSLSSREIWERLCRSGEEEEEDETFPFPPAMKSEAEWKKKSLGGRRRRRPLKVKVRWEVEGGREKLFREKSFFLSKNTGKSLAPFWHRQPKVQKRNFGRTAPGKTVHSCHFRFSWFVGLPKNGKL